MEIFNIPGVTNEVRGGGAMTHQLTEATRGRRIECVIVDDASRTVCVVLDGGDRTIVVQGCASVGLAGRVDGVDLNAVPGATKTEVHVPGCAHHAASKAEPAPPARADEWPTISPADDPAATDAEAA